MARYVYKLIPLSEILSKQTYGFRLNAADETLLASIRRRGILQPLVITPHSREVISGHRRLEAARTLALKEVESLELATEPTPQDAFLLAVLSNWHQPFSEIEKARIIVTAVNSFGFSEPEVLNEIFPAMKMNPEKNSYDEAFEVMSLHAAILDLIAAEKMPFRGARILAHFNAEDQCAFAALANQASFTTNQLLKIGEWLYDLLKIEKLPLESFLKRDPLDAILNSSQLRPLKGECFFSTLRALSFPKVAEKENQFLAFSEQFRNEKMGLSVERPPFFEGEGFTLKVKVKSPESLESVIVAIQSKRKELNSLLDIVL